MAFEYVKVQQDYRTTPSFLFIQLGVQLVCCRDLAHRLEVVGDKTTTTLLLWKGSIRPLPCSSSKKGISNRGHWKTKCSHVIVQPVWRFFVNCGFTVTKKSSSSISRKNIH
ncbi:hypothetical protein GAYE_SCF59G6421 [Galdieria yellowstonensis]|uniref:Uncharacterized protein n=1 Tax=Galdieria yellowstonensis TaxID=3028027 RepID=A0AAV9IMG0_9RHOD|nr:hypothetical protein GAYE_SCF28MG4795 [Galdieria yellowstonensis]KAK4528478.1 hypothetical protein GAYE_SCF59G6421 [Galdieria yellowstonensis]